MAVYFLEKSNAYRQQTDQKVYRRREVVALNLQDNYKVRKFGDDEVFAQIVADLAREQIEITKSTYQADKVMLDNVQFSVLLGGEYC